MTDDSANDGLEIGSTFGKTAAPKGASKDVPDASLHKIFSKDTASDFSTVEHNGFAYVMYKGEYPVFQNEKSEYFYATETGDRNRIFFDEHDTQTIDSINGFTVRQPVSFNDLEVLEHLAQFKGTAADTTREAFKAATHTAVANIPAPQRDDAAPITPDRTLDA